MDLLIFYLGLLVDHALIDFVPPPLPSLVQETCFEFYTEVSIFLQVELKGVMGLDSLEFRVGYGV